MWNSLIIVKKYRLLTALLFIPMIALLAACGGGSDSGPAPTNAVAPTEEALQSTGESTTQEGVRVIDIQAAFVVPYFTPDPIILKTGEPVQFRIISADTRHTFTVTELNLDTQVTQRLIGETAVTQVITPQTTGTFRLWCRIHINAPVMEGVIQVVE